MPLGLTLLPQRFVNLNGPPLARFQIGATLNNSGDVPIAVLGLWFSVTYKDGICVQDERDCPLARQPCLNVGEAVDLYMPVAMARAVVDAIEAKRDGGVDLQISASALAAPLIPSGSRETRSFLGEPQRIPLDVRNPVSGDRTLPISRDAWLSALSAFKYSEVQVFELPIIQLGAKLKAEALTQVSAAEVAFRAGDWDGTLAKCRRAFEGIAKAAGESDDLAAGFKSLWPALLPDERDKPKRDALNALAHGLKDLLHLGRHESYPFLKVDRTDALLGLRATLAMFAYMGMRAGSQ
jgi:hypothetical protein